MGRLIDSYDGIQEIHHYDKSTGKNVIETRQDVGDILDLNAKQKNDSSQGWAGDMHHVGRVPLVLIEKWNEKYKCNVLKPENRHLLMIELRSSEYSKLRTKEGRI